MFLFLSYFSRRFYYTVRIPSFLAVATKVTHPYVKVTARREFILIFFDSMLLQASCLARFKTLYQISHITDIKIPKTIPGKNAKKVRFYILVLSQHLHTI